MRSPQRAGEPDSFATHAKHVCNQFLFIDSSLDDKRSRLKPST